MKPEQAKTMTYEQDIVRKKEILLVGLEFVQPLFSGNGILTQSVVRGLLHLNYNVTVVCARPSSSPPDETTVYKKLTITIENDNVPDRMDDDERLHVVTVPVPMSTWKRLDRYSCYEHLANGAVKHMISTLKSVPTFNYVFAIDWSSIPTIAVLKDSGILSSTTIRVFLVFRVFSSSKELLSSDEDYKFYVTNEMKGIQQSDLTFVLSHVDQRGLLDGLGGGGGGGLITAEKYLHVHVPPLRNDIYLKCKQIKVLSQQQRKYLLCNVRLSPEKNAIVFANIVKKLAEEGIFTESKLIPVLIGSVCDDDYAQRVYKVLPPETMIINRFLDSNELISILLQTVLMIHPPTYDAYGMTIAEAAAVGVPSLIHHENIGASSLFRVEEAEILHGDMNSPQVSDCVKEYLSSLEKLAMVSDNARRRALSWSVNEYAKGLEAILDSHLRE